MYLSTFYGGNTLCELRQAFLIADSEGPTGVAPRLGEFMELPTAANLMHKIGFKDPVVDRALLEVTYDQVEDLLQDLKQMQETNIVKERSKGLTSKRSLDRMQSIYKANNRTCHGRLRATFELFYMTGLK